MNGMMMRTSCVLLAAVLVAACGGEPREGAAGSSSDSAGAAAAVDTAAASAGSGTGTVLLAPDGLEVAGAGGTERLAFGAGRAQVLARAATLLAAPQEQGQNEECPAGPLSYAQYAGGLQLVFQDSAFVGWAARQGSAFRTARGIGPGSTLGEVKSAYPAATVQQTSLGTEFSVDALYGVFSDSTDQGRLEMMFGGTNCIFR